MKWAIAVTTAPRREVYLEETLRSLVRAGWTHPILWAEPGSAIPRSARGLRIVRNSYRLGPLANFRVAIRELIEAIPDADAYATFQDDIAVTANLRRWLDQTLWPSSHVGVVSLYTAAANAKADPGWHRCLRLPAKAIGALAYVFPPDAARRVSVGLSEVTAWNRVDYWVGRSCQVAGLEYWMHSPSFVRHTGEISSIHDRGLDERRQCGSFMHEI